jgi:hypothetical protein
VYFQLDRDHDGSFWIDRRIDGKADQLSPCPRCRAEMEEICENRTLWHRLDLCPSCWSRLEIASAVGEAADNRPYIYDREPLRYPEECGLLGDIDDDHPLPL